jgi:hypothetical protein
MKIHPISGRADLGFDDVEPKDLSRNGLSHVAPVILYSFHFHSKIFLIARPSTEERNMSEQKGK